MSNLIPSLPIKSVFLVPASLVAAILAGCGGGQVGAETATPADNATPAATSPGAQCIEEANLAWEPRSDAPDKIEVSHLLVRHRELDRPNGATRSPEEACLRAQEALSALQGGAGWDETIEEYSDSGKSTAGNLGRVSLDELDPAFGAAAFALESGQLSLVVESERGFHVILRTE